MSGETPAVREALPAYAPEAPETERVPPGYRPSEVGVIPEDWEQTTIGERAIKVGSGITPTGGSRVYKQVGRAFLRSQNVGWGQLLMDEIAYIDEPTHETFKETEVKAGDVLLNITGASIGRSAIADDRVEGGNVNQHVCIIRPGRDLDPGFLNSFLLSSSGQRQIDSFQAGGNREGLNFMQIRSFLLPLPPLPEQRAIATALSDVDALISALDRLIAKKRAVKTAAMQQLLTGKQRLPEFSGEWEIRTLEEVADVDSDNLTADTDPDYEFNYISLEDIDRGALRGFSYQRFSSSPSRARRRVRPGDVLVSTVRPNLRSHLLFSASEGDWVCSTGFSLARCRKWLACPGFVYQHLFHGVVPKQIEALIAGSNYPAISAKDVRAFQIPMPSVEEQTAIAAVLSDMDAEIEALEARREKTRQVKQGMMQELLTGKTRLV